MRRQGSRSGSMRASPAQGLDTRALTVLWALRQGRLHLGRALHACRLAPDLRLQTVHAFIPCIPQWELAR
ncbi:hypothetical protein Y88_0161 [Novosphingobium nitrogenifigens DSM 19370]|uniref:Uncharacterized protein n=1 Tax=Novosphingobium nitrogenifigens DSM 19370 TaxID=983920 RepID=F1ZB24_9SPHN|nr:hypothetical protein Y88_0161 [Novosphingobium nitrogenifigens DSM 19370]